MFVGILYKRYSHLVLGLSLKYLKDEDEAKDAVIIVCPKNVKHNWKAEFKLWRPDYQVEILAGDFSFRWPKPGEVLIFNYDILPDWLKLRMIRSSISGLVDAGLSLLYFSSLSSDN